MKSVVVLLAVMAASWAMRGPMAASPQDLFTPMRVDLKIGDGAKEAIEAAYVAPGFFNEAPVAMGRPITDHDCSKASAAVAVISDELWKNRFERASSVVGSQLEINGRAVTIIGIGRPGFRPQGSGWLWLPRADR
jgi:hypothetical protein